MSSVWLLTRLQVQQLLGGMRATVEKRVGAHGAMAGTALIAIAIFAGVAWLGHAAYGVVGGLGLETTAYAVLFVLCGALTFVLSLPQVMGEFFGSSDINDLLPLPVSPFAIAISKALCVLAPAYLFTALIIAAPLAGWGIAARVGLGYWVVYVLAIAFTPMMPVAYAGTLSIVLATLFKRVRRKDTISTIATVLSLGLGVGVYLLTSNLHPGNNAASALGGISGAVGNAIMAFPAYGFVVGALAHPDPLGCALFVLVSLAAFAVFIIVTRVLYLRIVTTLTSGAGRADAYNGVAGQGHASTFGALLLCEVRKVTRNSSIALNYVGYPFIFAPLILFSLFSTGSMEKLATALAELGDVTYMAAGFVLFTFMFLALICMLNNRLASTCISREGSNWTHMKFIPVPMLTQIRAKALVGYTVNAALSVLFMAVGGYFLVAMTGADLFVSILGGALMLAASWLMTCICTLSDARRPRVEWGNDGDVNVRTLRGGGGMLRAFGAGMLYALLPLAASPLTGVDPRMGMPVIALLGVSAALAIGHVLLTAAARAVEAHE